MRFAIWLRRFIDELMRTPYLRSLETQLVQERKDFWTLRLQAQQDFEERIRDKNAVIADLRLRLAVAEADALRAQVAKVPAVPIPVPEFSGPVSFQDELAGLSLEVEETHDAV